MIHAVLEYLAQERRGLLAAIFVFAAILAVAPAIKAIDDQSETTTSQRD